MEYLIIFLILALNITICIYVAFKKRKKWLLIIAVPIIILAARDQYQSYELRSFLEIIQADTIEVICLKNKKSVVLPAAELLTGVSAVSSIYRKPAGIELEEQYVINFFKNDKRVGRFIILSVEKNSSKEFYRFRLLKNQRLTVRRGGRYYHLMEQFYSNLNRILEDNDKLICD
ncbi:MAG: hypothetical protein ACLKAL_13290 [Alkaliphilus sp.]